MKTNTRTTPDTLEQTGCKEQALLFPELIQRQVSVDFQADSDSGFVFMPHAMDQMFFNPEGLLLPPMQGLVAQSLLEIPQFKNLYHARIKNLVEQLMAPEALKARFREILAKTQVVLKAHNEAMAKEQANHAQVVLTRVLERAGYLERLLPNEEEENCSSN